MKTKHFEKFEKKEEEINQYKIRCTRQKRVNNEI